MKGWNAQNQIRESRLLKTGAKMQPVTFEWDETTNEKSMEKIEPEVDRIIWLMLRYTKEERQGSWVASVREEAIYELARLTLWLSDSVVKKKLEERAIHELDAESERVFASSTSGLERIESTARILADNIWTKKYYHWHRHTNRIVGAENTGSRSRRNKVYDPTKARQFTRENHP